jgi:hypothetical protein
MDNELYLYIGRLYVQVVKDQEQFEQVKEIIKKKDAQIEELQKQLKTNGTEQKHV